MIRTSFAVSALLVALCGTASAADNPALKKCMDSAETTLALLLEGTGSTIHTRSLARSGR